MSSVWRVYHQLRCASQKYFLIIAKCNVGQVTEMKPANKNLQSSINSHNCPIKRISLEVTAESSSSLFNQSCMEVLL